MSKPYIETLLQDLKRWGFDVSRTGRKYTATLLGGDPLTFTVDQPNRELRTLHEAAAASVGKSLNRANGKTQRARHRATVEAVRQYAAGEVADIEQQIAQQRNRAALRRAVIRRTDELRFYENLMRA